MAMTYSIDYDGIASGNFGAVILENIRARAHFLVLLTPTALERCGDPKDWMRREIEAALDSQRNIVPLMLAGFDFGTPAIASQLTGKLAALKEYNGLEIPKGYFSPAMERLRNKFLSVPVDAVLHSASVSAQQAATEQKDKATMALGEALRQPWLSQEEPRKQEGTAAQHRAEEERRRQEKLQEEARQRAEEERRREEAETKRRLFQAEAEEALRQKVQRPSSGAARLKAPGRWRILAGSALALLMVGWVGLYLAGVPVWMPWAPDPRADNAKAAADAEAQRKATEAEQRQAQAAADAEAKRKAAETEQQRLKEEEQRQAKAAADAEAKRKAAEAEQQRLAALKAQEERKAKAEAEVAAAVKPNEKLAGVPVIYYRKKPTDRW
jgi:hypothetical protein